MSSAPRILVIGAGARGHAYARAITSDTTGTVVGIAEPIEWKRQYFQKLYSVSPDNGLSFSSWREIIENREKVEKEVDGICVCTLDETHAEIVIALRPLNLHILCEKPLATTAEDCRGILEAVVKGGSKQILFAIGHVLRYSPHNHLLRKLLCEDAILGEIVNINHTEPVGWWHFTHAYVRGNWRSSKTTAPSLLTKCCHDLDLLMWLLASPYISSNSEALPRKTSHYPTQVSSHGSLVAFQPSRRPAAAGNATNCLVCPAERICQYSAKKIYIERHLHKMNNRRWPIKIIVPEIEDAPSTEAAEEMIMAKLSEDHTPDMDVAKIEERPWFGRCVFGADNNVVDNQVVTLSWDDDLKKEEGGRGAKTATLTMIAHTQNVCERATRVYGTKGELSTDSTTIEVWDFETDEKKIYKPEQHIASGHGGGDIGLARAFVDAIAEVKAGGDVAEAQKKWIKCTAEEAVLSHEVVFWAEQARVQRKMLGWEEWFGKGENTSLINGH